MNVIPETHRAILICYLRLKKKRVIFLWTNKKNGHIILLCFVFILNKR